MKVLIVVDMQNDFIDGSLANPSAQEIIPNVIKKIQDFNGDLIIFTRDCHQDNYLETTEGKLLPIEHCIENTHGWQIHSDLMKVANEHPKPFYVVDKPTFGYKDWSTFFERHNINPTEIEIIGTCTDICVVSNTLILKAEYPDASITVDAACCVGLTKEKHTAALDVMKSCQVRVVNY